MDPPSRDRPPRAAVEGSSSEVFDFRLQVEQTAALARREEHFRLMAAATFEGLALTDEGRIVAVNEQLATMLGYREDELIGRDVAGLVAPHARDRVAEAIRGGAEGQYTHTALRKDGTTLEVEVRARPAPTAGRALRVTAIRDVTEQRRHEIALRSTLEATPHVAVQWYDDRGRIVYWNPASERMFGYAAHETEGKTLDQLIHTPEEAAAFLETLRDVEHSGRPAGPSEYTFRRRDGSQGTCLSTVFAIPGPTGERCFVCMDVDITARKQAEADRAELVERLHQAQKLEAIGTLAGGIAHDFNNVLGVIFVLGGLIAHDRGASDAVRRNASEVLIAAGRARELVRQILSFRGGDEAPRAPTDLGPIVRETATLLRSTVPGAVELEVVVGDDVPPVRAVPAQIHQIVMNLATNAAHALGGDPGRIELRVERTAVGVERARAIAGLSAGLHACITVRDDGPGMAPETLARIFEPFFTTKPAGTGTGLGLAVVHGLVKGHQGGLEVESAPGRGTTFRIYLPAATDDDDAR